jgi:eukaryotic-like serine/threonine-protein kinase
MGTLTPALWQRLQALFNQAFELPIADREMWLRSQPQAEEALVQRVLKMLEADAALDQIPEQSASSALIGEPEIRPGEKLGVYTIKKLIGAGGMGQVYLAARTDGVVAQQVAIKLLHGFGNTQELKRRFDQERRILARLQHPSIARFLDAGADKKGRPYVVMEFIDGASISDFCARQKLELPARLALFTQVLDAVVYAHAQLIVHRDIKPSNVLVDSSGQVRLLDFGIAKPLLDLDDSLRAGERTATAMSSFSMRYAAPEQLSGAATGVSCDIYALGGLLFELLTGNPPLDLDDKSFADAANAIQYTLPMLPSAHKDAPVSAKLLKGDLDRICLHALKKGPNERYASAEAFRRDIISVLNREPISLRSGVASYRARKFVGRYKLPVALAATLILGLTASSTVLYLQQSRLKIERDRAQAEQQRAEQEQTRATSVTELLLSAFRAADPSQNRGEKLLAREVLDQAALKLEDASLDAASMVTLSTTLGTVYHSLGLHPNARKLVDHALRQASTAPAIEQAQLWHLNAALHLQADQRTERTAAVKQSALLLKGTDPLSPVGIRQQRHYSW